MANKRRRLVFEDINEIDGTDHTINSRVIVCAPSTGSSKSKNRGAVATSGQTDVPDDQTTTSSPPQKRMKHKSATRRGSSAELSTLVKQTAVSSVPTRMSARLATKIHASILSKSRDVYPHLASEDSLDSAGSFREEHGVTGSSIPSAPTLKKKRGKPPRNISLADEGAKAALMEQWANLRMSQGTLLSSTGRDTTLHLSSNPGSQEPSKEVEIPSGEVIEPDKSHPTPANDYIESTCPRPFGSPSDLVAEPLPEMPATNEPLSTPPQAEAEGLATYNTSAERLPLSDYDLRYPSSSPENRLPVIEDMAPSQYVDEGTKETIAQASHFPANGSPEAGDQLLRLLATDSDIMLLHPPGSPIMSKLDILPETTISVGPAAPAEPEDSSTRASLSAVDMHPPGSPIMSKFDILPETTISAGPAAPAEPEDSSTSLSTVDIQLVVSSQADIDDVVLGFHMLDLHEVLSPWVPISPTAPSVYVPPAVQHLITAMNRQLEIECQARRRAEELYLEEMRKRIKMEEVVDKLQKEREQTREQGTSQQPPSLDAAPRAASAHASPEVACQQDSEAKPTPTDITGPNVTTEDFCA